MYAFWHGFENSNLSLRPSKKTRKREACHGAGCGGSLEWLRLLRERRKNKNRHGASFQTTHIEVPEKDSMSIGEYACFMILLFLIQIPVCEEMEADNGHDPRTPRMKRKRRYQYQYAQYKRKRLQKTQRDFMEVITEHFDSMAHDGLVYSDGRACTCCANQFYGVIYFDANYFNSRLNSFCWSCRETRTKSHWKWHTQLPDMETSWDGQAPISTCRTKTYGNLSSPFIPTASLCTKMKAASATRDSCYRPRENEKIGGGFPGGINVWRGLKAYEVQQAREEMRRAGVGEVAETVRGETFCGERGHRMEGAVARWELEVTDAGDKLNGIPNKCVQTALLHLIHNRKQRKRMRETLSRLCNNAGMSGWTSSSSCRENILRTERCLEHRGYFAWIIAVSSLTAWYENVKAFASPFGPSTGQCIGWLLHCTEEKHVYVLRREKTIEHIENVYATGRPAFTTGAGGRDAAYGKERIADTSPMETMLQRQKINDSDAFLKPEIYELPHGEVGDISPLLLNSVAHLMQSIRTNGNGACSIHALLGTLTPASAGKKELFCAAARQVIASQLGPSLEAVESRVGIEEHMRAIKSSFWEELAVAHIRGPRSTESELFWQALTKDAPLLALEA
jgi:hypothetical protein